MGNRSTMANQLRRIIDPNHSYNHFNFVGFCDNGYKKNEQIWSWLKLDRPYEDGMRLVDFICLVGQEGINRLDPMKTQLPAFLIDGNKVSFDYRRISDLDEYYDNCIIRPNLIVGENKNPKQEYGFCYQNLYDCFGFEYDKTMFCPKLEDLLKDFQRQLYLNNYNTEYQKIPEFEVTGKTIHFYSNTTISSKKTVEDLIELNGLDGSYIVCGFKEDFLAEMFFKTNPLFHEDLFNYYCIYPERYNNRAKSFTTSARRLSRYIPGSEEERLFWYKQNLNFWKRHEPEFAKKYERFLSEEGITPQEMARKQKNCLFKTAKPFRFSATVEPEKKEGASLKEEASIEISKLEFEKRVELAEKELYEFLTTQIEADLFFLMDEYEKTKKYNLDFPLYDPEKDAKYIEARRKLLRTEDEIKRRTVEYDVNESPGYVVPIENLDDELDFEKSNVVNKQATDLLYSSLNKPFKRPTASSGSFETSNSEFTESKKENSEAQFVVIKKPENRQIQPYDNARQLLDSIKAKDQTNSDSDTESTVQIKKHQEKNSKVYKAKGPGSSRVLKTSQRRVKTKSLPDQDKEAWDKVSDFIILDENSKQKHVSRSKNEIIKITPFFDSQKSRQELGRVPFSAGNKVTKISFELSCIFANRRKRNNLRKFQFVPFKNHCYAEALDFFLRDFGIVCIDLFQDGVQHDLAAYWRHLVKKFALHEFLYIQILEHCCLSCNKSKMRWIPGTVMMGPSQMEHEELIKCSNCKEETRTAVRVNHIFSEFVLWISGKPFEDRNLDENLVCEGNPFFGIRYIGNAEQGHYEPKEPYNYCMVTQMCGDLPKEFILSLMRDEKITPESIAFKLKYKHRSLNNCSAERRVLNWDLYNDAQDLLQRKEKLDFSRDKEIIKDTYDD